MFIGPVIRCIETQTEPLDPEFVRPSVPKQSAAAPSFRAKVDKPIKESECVKNIDQCLDVLEYLIQYI